jgi:DNA-binding transcriptional ArsR family regulator
MRGVKNDELRELAVQLRRDQRLSFSEIAEATGAAKGSLSEWLKAYPLTEAERQLKAKKAVRVKSRGDRSSLYVMVEGRALSRHQKGKIAEAATLLRLVLQGFTPFGSVFDGDKADWFVEAPGGRAWRIQVKWVKREKHGLPRVPLKCREGHAGYRRYKEGEFDFIVGYDLFTDTCYVWSFDELKDHSTGVTICPEAAERWDKLV